MFSEVLHGLVGRTQRDAGVDQNQPRATLVPSPLRIGIIPAGTWARRWALSTGGWGGWDLSTGQGLGIQVCPLGAPGCRRLSTMRGPDVRICPLGRARCPGVRVCPPGAGRMGCPWLCLQVHFRHALLSTHLAWAHGCVWEGVLSSSLGTRFPPGGGVGLCSQRAGRWWWVGSGVPEHSGGDGEPGEQAAWKKRLVPGAGAGCQGGGPRGVRWLACPELAGSACSMTQGSTSFFQGTHCSQGVGGEAGALRTSNREGTPSLPLSEPQRRGPWWVRLGCEWCRHSIF